MISILEENINHFVVSYLKLTELKKKIIAKVTLPFDLKFLNAVLETVSVKENCQ